MTTNSLEGLIAGRNFKWVITGVAGFIGSHLAEALLALGQSVTGLDDFSTGSPRNVTLAEAAARRAGSDFRFIEGSIESPGICASVCHGSDIVLHQAALGSIPRSIENPVRTHTVNATGTLNMLTAARDAGVKRFVYASSSSIYGDDTGLLKEENRTGAPLAPYASSKRACEMYARNFADHYALQTIGLRYFNVFGPRQDPEGAYAAVIPKWISQISKGEQVCINGDGETSRDFCYVANVVQANVRAALIETYPPGSNPLNIAFGERTSLNQLFGYIAGITLAHTGRGAKPPAYGPQRSGDVRHSQADISRARQHLGYSPRYDVVAGLKETLTWFYSQRKSKPDLNVGLDLPLLQEIMTTSAFREARCAEA
jgi:Nucleoside-diphosphate-sugar epimerases